LPFRNDNRIKLLAVSTKERSSLMPELPGMAEAGIADYDISLWTGILAPAGTPQAVVDKLNKEINAVLALPEVKEALARQGAATSGGSAKDFAEKIRTESALWKDVVKTSNIVIE
jgi:tripartite-type tricarboxylate transporter receptor subunit TctC